jgi:endonuclease/exonuclease/phosphatase family metal-dependent hydrolase
MDDFLFLATSFEAALLSCDRIDAMLNSLGLSRNSMNVVWTPTQVSDHLGLTIDPGRGEF